MKKGVLLTLGITMLVTIVFSLAVLLFHNTQSMEKRFSELVLFDRLSDCDSMVQSNIRDINAYESGLYITVGNNNVSFTEAFPRSDKFAEVMEEYEDYMKTNYTAANITFDEEKMSDIKDHQLMYIRPHNIMYEHHDGFPGESYRLEPSDDNVISYNMSITVNAVSIQDPGLECGVGAETFKVYLRIVPYEGGFPYICEWRVNPEIQNTVEINMLNAQGQEAGDIDIQVGSTEHYAYLEVNGEKIRTSILNIMLTEPGAQDGPIEVKYDDDLFTIHFEEAKLLKKGTVKLA